MLVSKFSLYQTPLHINNIAYPIIHILSSVCICCAAIFCHYSLVEIVRPLILANIIHSPFLKYRSFRFDCCI